MADRTHPEVHGLLALVDLEAAARRAQSLEELYFTVVNETARLLPYTQAVLLSTAPTGKPRARVEAVSNVAVIERDAPFVRWLQASVDALSGNAESPTQGAARVGAADLPESLRSDWSAFAAPHVLACPLRLVDGTGLGVLWLTRETPWSDQDLVVLARLAETFAHAWAALAGRRRSVRHGWSGRWLLVAVLVAVAAILTIRVPLSVLAPARVVAARPAVVSAPIDGVIAAVHVPPNTVVLDGQPIFEFEGTSLRNRHEIAEKALAVAVASYRTATQGAFVDRQRKASVQLLKAQVDLSQAELDYASDLLSRLTVTAPRDGLLLYAAEEDWIGRPVVVGERIMVVADPAQIELRIDLAVDDAIVLREGARAQVFLDVDPLAAHEARVERFSYEAVVNETGVLAYDVRAGFVTGAEGVRIGYQGTAKVYGESVPLGFLIFRRPLAALRQRVGF